jgi:hypothetical protein
MRECGRERANQELRYAISVLRGRSGIVSTRKGRLQIALILKDRFREDGFWWQEKILGSWIHRFQRGDFES